MTALSFDVLGTPAPQGSKRGYVRGGRVQLVDDNKKPLHEWRGDVVRAAVEALPGIDSVTADHSIPVFGGAVLVDVEFRFPRPKSHYGTGRNADILKLTAPLFPTGKPDADKLLRAVFDALTAARVWRDDCQVAYLHARKIYADARKPGATVRVEDYDEIAASQPDRVEEGA